MVLVDGEVGDRRLQLHGHRDDDGAAAAVGLHGHVKGVGHVADLLHLGDAAGGADIGLRHLNGVLLEVIQIVPAANCYEITSNREAGDGRFDICLKPRASRLPGILIELKAANNRNGLKELAKEAVRQIDNKRYSVAMEETGIASVLKYGVAFCGKFVEVELG